MSGEPNHGIPATDVCIGIDVGSTTVKAVLVDPTSHRILWSDYQRHQTRQAEKVRGMRVAMGNDLVRSRGRAAWIRTFITGSAAGPLVGPLGSKFVQEVNAVTLAVEKLYPDVGSVVELGGQDAKIIIFKTAKSEDGEGEKTAVPSMNDKCASGTGATIDKCMIKVGLAVELVREIHFDDA